MENSDHSVFLIRIHPADNTFVLAKSVCGGAAYRVAGRDHTFGRDLNLGHKIAAQPIAKGEKVLKYGVSIGSTLRDVPAGEHVHLHNMQSDYLPTYTLEEGSQYGK